MNPFINRLRGLLAIGVALSHAVGLALMLQVDQDSFLNALAPFLLFTGFNYVVGFIVVSGYCIARSCLREDFSLLGYVALRVTRIYPTLITCAIVAGIVELTWRGTPYRVEMWDSPATWHYFIINVFGLGGFYGQFASFAPSYTVSYELLFYLIWGIVFAAAPRRFAVPISALTGFALYFLLPGNYHFALVLFASWLMGAAIALHEKEIVSAVRLVPLWAVWLLAIVAFILLNQAAAFRKISIWGYPGSVGTAGIGLIFAAVIAAHLSKRGRHCSWITGLTRFRIHFF